MRALPLFPITAAHKSLSPMHNAQSGGAPRPARGRHIMPPRGTKDRALHIDATPRYGRIVHKSHGAREPDLRGMPVANEWITGEYPARSAPFI